MRWLGISTAPWKLVRIQEAARATVTWDTWWIPQRETPEEVADVIWALVHDPDFITRYREAPCAS